MHTAPHAHRMHTAAHRMLTACSPHAHRTLTACTPHAHRMLTMLTMRTACTPCAPCALHAQARELGAAFARAKELPAEMPLEIVISGQEPGLFWSYFVNGW